MNEVNATEDRLRSEIEALKRQLEEQKHLHAAGNHANRRPSTVSLVLIALLLAVLIVVGFSWAFFRDSGGSGPRRGNERERRHSPVVNVSRVTRSAAIASSSFREHSP
jgi:hypothetical protein